MSHSDNNVWTKEKKRKARRTKENEFSWNAQMGAWESQCKEAKTLK